MSLRITIPIRGSAVVRTRLRHTLLEQSSEVGSRARPRRHAADGSVCARLSGELTAGGRVWESPRLQFQCLVSHVFLHCSLTWARAKPRDGRGPGQGHTWGA